MNLPVAVRALFEREAKNYRRLGDGSTWYVAVWLERTRLENQPARTLNVRAREFLTDEAPSFFCPSTLSQFPTEDAVRAEIQQRAYEIHEKAKEAARAKKKGELGSNFVSGFVVQQVQADGLLIRRLQDGDASDRLIRLTGHPFQKSVVDKDRIGGDFEIRFTGRYQYTSVSGAVSTIEQFAFVQNFDWQQLVPPPPSYPDIVSELTPQALYETLVKEEWKGLPEWRLSKRTSPRGRGQPPDESWVWELKWRQITEQIK